MGLASEGEYVGAGASVIDFKSTTGTAINVIAVSGSSGVGTVQITPGVTLGLAIALGG